MGWRVWMTCSALILSCVLVAGLGATATAGGLANSAGRLAYDRGGQIYISATDGADARRIGTAGDGLLISPNGDEVATVKSLGAGIAVDVYAGTGGRPTEVTLSPSEGAINFIQLVGYSPDSRYLAVSGLAGIQIIDLRSREIATSLVNLGAGSWAPTLPDRVAAGGTGDGGGSGVAPLSIWTAATDTTRDLLLQVSDPVWGRRDIAVGYHAQVWTVSSSGTDMKDLTHFHSVGLDPASAFVEIAPALWSPDGRTLLADYTGGALRHDCVLSLRTGRCPAIVVRKDYAYPVAFNATGTGFLVSFGTADYAPRGLADRVATINLSGSEVHTLIPDAGQPSWTF